jgi:hypothetical protein
MAYYALIAPKQQWIDANGNPLSGAKLFTYEAGTSTKKTTYTDDTGATPNANPIALNSAGQSATGVYGSTGAYKLVLAPSTDTDPPLSPIWTQDGVAGINDVAATAQDEWVPSGFAPTFISGTSFSVAGNQTATLQVGRRIKVSLSGSTRYGFIISASFGAGITTVVATFDTGSLDATISSVAYGLISATNSSAPRFPVIQIVHATDAGASSSSTSYASLNGSTKSITPRLSTSKILIEVSYFASVNYVAAFNAAATLSVYETTPGANLSAEYILEAFSAGGGIGTSGAGIIRIRINSTGVTARSFGLQGKVNNASSLVTATNLVWTITEYLE